MKPFMNNIYSNVFPYNLTAQPDHTRPIKNESKSAETKISIKKMSTPGNDGMDKLIPIINGLLDACTKTNVDLQIDLPQIAVVGSQSAGKSSVLENFVGKDFLPRGSGIVTRRPLILQLTNDKEKEYGQFLHCKNKIFDDFEDIRSEIQAETDRITGTNKGISDEPINLRIFSPHVLDLTLVDLPGLTKVPIGDQPSDIEEQTKSMILNYIRKENCLILAVTPANIDLANSDALKLAREVDPEGIRTIGVITKLDLMDKGTDARDILENRVLPLQRGYIGVVNRSQMDIEGKTDIQTALKAELDFFVQHPSYNHMADRCGTTYLQQTLNQELTNHIFKSIPTLREELQKKITFYEREVDKLKWCSHLNDTGEMKHMILSVAQELAADFKNEIGAFGQESVKTKELSSGAKINLIFHKRLAKEIDKIDYYSEDKIMDDIDITIRNIHGIRCGLYSPQMAFEKFTEQEIHKLKTPIDLIINLVIEELMNAVRKCTQNIIFPNLREFFKKDILKYISEMTESAKCSVLVLVDIEKSYINTNHLDFEKKDDGSTADEDDYMYTSVKDKGAKKMIETNDESTLHGGVSDIHDKILIYMENVKKNMNDLVPKAITFHLIKKIVNYVNHDVIFNSTNIPFSDFPKLLKLDRMDAARYEAYSSILAACKEALASIDDLSDQANAIDDKGAKNANN